MKLTVLVTTMNQTDFSLVEKMNIQSDAVIGNQADRFEIQEEIVNGHRIRMVTTPFRGTSRNRNTALEFADESDIIMFMDDDFQFTDGYEAQVIQEFERHPEAEFIKFNIYDLPGHRFTNPPAKIFSRATRAGSKSFNGVWGGAIRTSARIRENLFFDEGFGPGMEKDFGEDTIYIQGLFSKGLKVYKSPLYIANMLPSESTWNNAFDEHRFYCMGSVLKKCYPKWWHLLACRAALRLSKRDDVDFSAGQILQLIFEIEKRRSSKPASSTKRQSR